MDGNSIMEGNTRKKFNNIWSLLFCVSGIVINILGAFIMHHTDSPLFLDSFGTVSVAVLGGYVPGIIVGLATGFASAVFEINAIYYGLLNVLTAVVIAFFAKKGFLKKPHTIILLIIILTIISGGHGAIVNWFISGMVEDFGSLFTTEMLRTVYLKDIIDKTLDVILAVVLFVAVPDRIRKHVQFYAWKQTPLSDEIKIKVKKMECRRISMRTKLILLLSVAALAVAIAATAISVMLYRNNIIADNTKISTGVAKVAASIIDADHIDDYIENGESADGYKETEKLLYNIRDNTPNVMYLYVYKIMDDGCHVVFDLDTDEVEGGSPGDIVPFDESFSEDIPKLLAGEEIDPIISDDSFGWLLTSYVPVYDSNGKCSCYAACDVAMESLRTYEYSFFAKLILIFLGFFILVLAIGVYLAEYDIVIPVNSMAMCAKAFAYDSDEARDSSVERIRSLNILTGDEVENLYKSFLKTTEDSMQYVTDIKNKTETIASMQNGLIMVLADMVESRDQCTGDHIRKTAAYTKIIMESLKKKGYYVDQLTDEFISDVINSAPLHDIGKIHVSDVILNKPGRLTDEEFEIMKYHTTAGSEIISKAIDIVPESGYLNEARNLAEYHHEKWNGQGYPNGLSGEDIPLSARIMAVADVFDALVSRRSYKEPYSFEKAMSIIKEGSGTHFDPKIVEAFVDAEEEVLVVEREFSDS